jgi:hypothetical protein
VDLGKCRLSLSIEKLAEKVAAGEAVEEDEEEEDDE